MHYYQFNIGDYASHTAHLDPIEDLAYRRMLDLYYRTQALLPDDLPRLAKLLRLADHTDAIQAVLNEFFQRTPEGWANTRADKEISAYMRMANGGAKGAAKRWAKPSDSHPIATPCPPHANPNAKQEPLTKNHKPRTKNQEPREGTASPPPANLDLIAWQKWIDYRTKVKKPIKPASIEAAQVALAGHGIDQLAVVDQSIANGWQGLFPLKHATQPGAPPKSFAQQERELGMRRWEEMTGEIHPDRHAGAIDVPANFLTLEALPHD